MDDLLLHRAVNLPRIARIGPRATRELADDAARLGIASPLVITSYGLPASIMDGLRRVLALGQLPVYRWLEAGQGSMAEAEGFRADAVAARGVIAIGGGRALDVGKYAASLAEVPFMAVPTSLSNDGFASPSASLTDVKGSRHTLPCKGPAGVVVDTALCVAAPTHLTLAGVGDVVAKLTALSDWLLWEHSGEGKVDGIAATVAESAVAEIEAIEALDEAAVQRLARALLLGGVAMGIAGSSRPCSGSEHLISHALDRLKSPAGSHGLQVGLAAYLCSILQGRHTTSRIAKLFDRLNVWQAIREERLTAPLLAEALWLAPSVKSNYLTILSRPGAVEHAIWLLREDPHLSEVLA